MIEILLKIDGENITLNEKTSLSNNRQDELNSEIFGNTEYLEEDTLEKDADKAFAEIKVNNPKSTILNRRVRQKEIKIEKYAYKNILYAKVGNMFIRFYSDDTCEKIASSTYYKYRARQTLNA